jgi:hypothetical protein
MKKVKLLFILFISIQFLAKAQEQGKTSLGIFPFSYAAGTVYNENDVRSIQEAISTGLVKTKRFEVLDRTLGQVVKFEQEIQKGEGYIDSKKLAMQGKSIGAQYIVAGHVNSSSVEESSYTNEKGETTLSYTAKISVNLKIINVETGETEKSEIITGSSSRGLMGTILRCGTPQVAMGKAIESIDKEVDKFVATNFPIRFYISEIQEKDGRGNAKKILIAGGSAFGVKKGDNLSVVEIVEAPVEGKMVQRRKEIGKMKVVKVEDENFSICEVKEGGIEINSKFEAKAKLQVITKD